MTLTELRTVLVAAATGTDIKSVFFDYNKAANKARSKDYPLVLWDFVGMDEIGPLRSTDPKATFTIYVWAVKKYTPEAVEKMTGIKADDLRKAARIYASAETGRLSVGWVWDR